MRRWTTPLIVVGVVTLGLLAAADALRSGGESKVVSEAPTTTRASPPTLRETLRREAVTGFVLYSDDDCRLHSLLLPTLVDDIVRKEDGKPLVQCGFELGGGRILKEGDRLSPDRTLVAACQPGGVVVWETESGAQRRSYPGCPPAWRPDGRLTYPQGDRIMEDERVLYSADELRAAARTNPTLESVAPGIPLFVHATGLTWLDEERLVVSLEARVPGVEPQYLTVLFFGNALVGAASRFGQISENWIASSAGSFAAAEDASIVERDGNFTEPPDKLPPGRAVAFSPDEQWLAYTTGVSIYLIGTPRNSEPGRIIQLPIAAKDLVWEPAGAPTTGTTTAVR
jgi:hypothetical protein